MEDKHVSKPHGKGVCIAYLYGVETMAMTENSMKVKAHPEKTSACKLKIFLINTLT